MSIKKTSIRDNNRNTTNQLIFANHGTFYLRTSNDEYDFQYNSYSSYRFTIDDKTNSNIVCFDSLINWEQLDYLIYLIPKTWWNITKIYTQDASDIDWPIASAKYYQWNIYLSFMRWNPRYVEIDLTDWIPTIYSEQETYYTWPWENVSNWWVSYWWYTYTTQNTYYTLSSVEYWQTQIKITSL